MHDELGKLYNRKDAAAYIRERYARPCTVGLLDKLAVKGTGPEFRRSGGRWVIYEEGALDKWARSLIGAPQRSTSESPPTARRPRKARSESSATAAA
jgi:hypothetical protein